MMRRQAVGGTAQLGKAAVGKAAVGKAAVLACVCVCVCVLHQQRTPFLYLTRCTQGTSTYTGHKARTGRP